jgi:hypothetical protein
MTNFRKAKLSMTPTDKLANLAFAAICIRDVFDATKPEQAQQLNRLAKVSLGISDTMREIKAQAGIR